MITRTLFFSIVVAILIFSQFLIVMVASLVRTLFFSSLIHSPLILIRFYCNELLGVFYFLIYRLFLFFFIKRTTSKASLLRNNQSRRSLVSLYLLSGFPPSPLFFLKLTLLLSILTRIKLPLIFFLIRTTIAFLSYLRIFGLNLVVNNSFSLSNLIVYSLFLMYTSR